jgi:AefR-like transcriptional repressor, C-terminal domain
VLERVLILQARGGHGLDEPALMELLAMRQHVGGERDADRAAGIARGVDAVGLMRISIAEARRFPELASSVHRMARGRGLEAVGRLLAEAAQSAELGNLPAFAPQRLATTAELFVDLVVLPLLLRALHGEKLESLCAEIELHVARSVAFFLAACRHGGIK